MPWRWALRLVGLGLGRLGRLQRGPDLLLTLFERFVQDGQDVPADDEQHDEEGDDLDDERPVGDEEVATG